MHHTLSNPKRRHLGEIYRNLVKDDASSVTISMAQLLQPLPRIDVVEFTQRLESVVWIQFFHLRNKRSSWPARTTVGMWTA